MANTLEKHERNKRIVELYLSGKSGEQIAPLVGLSDTQVRRILKDNGIEIRPPLFLDLIGQTFDRLTVIEYMGAQNQARYWLCQCTCGNEKILQTDHLRGGRIRSCGCLRRETLVEKQTTHGQSVRYKQTIEYTIHAGPKYRAKKEGLPFDLKLEDIKVPEFCPVLGIPLISSKGGMTDNSPTLDKLIPSLGYVKDNVRVISNRANRIKSDATYEEIQALANWLKYELYNDS